MTSPLPRSWTISWAHGAVTVQALGGMLAPLRFDLTDNVSISPLQVAPWGEEPGAPDPALPGVLRQLRGEWPCLPFGMSQRQAGLPAHWPGRDGLPESELDAGLDHGYCSNHDWTLVEHSAHQLRLAIDYPDGHPISRLEREITVDAARAALTVTLTIHARRDVQLPIGLHPTFAIPAEGLEVIAPSNAGIHTYPVPQEAGVSRLLPNTSATDLAAMPGRLGPLDFTRLPLPFNTEELMQVHDVRAPFILRYPASRVELQLDWDHAALPDALLWISNAGRSQAPWSGRHYALGIEPVNSFFDLGRVISNDIDHPLAGRRGLALRADSPTVISYTISAKPLSLEP